MYRIALFLAIMLAFMVPANADDWIAAKLRGNVFQLVDSAWQPLHRNEIVSDSRPIRTAFNGSVSFERGEETIQLGPNTEIRIHDRNGQNFTTVEETSGTVTIEAEVQNVQHFAVETPFLAAVVKGTRFTVKSTSRGAWVAVERGHVAVEDLHSRNHVTISAGQTAEVVGDSDGTTLTVKGHGKLPKVLNEDGSPVLTKQELKALEKAAKDPEKAAEKAAKEAKKAAEKDAKEAEKAAEKAAKEAEKAAKEAEKEKSDSSGKDDGDKKKKK
ncbi:MAG: FecR family protein [Devosia sp.]